MKNKITLLGILFLLLSLPGWAQDDDAYYVEEQVEEEKAPWREKVFFGGGGGLQFSSFGTYITLMPSVGYRITPRWSSGIMGTYQFVRYRDIQVSAHNYGASLFTRYFVLEQVYATAEYEQLNFQTVYLDGSKDRRWVDRMLVGAGYFQPNPRGRGGFHIGILYDLFYTSREGYPYNSPFVYRVGLTF